MASTRYKKPYPPEQAAGSRDPMNHNHTFLTQADAVDGHQHILLGTTSPAIPKKDTHVHNICLRTSFDPKSGPAHWHDVEIMTGPAFETPDGNHIHYYAGSTSFDLDHCHAFSSVTDTSPEHVLCVEPAQNEKPVLPQYKR